MVVVSIVPYGPTSRTPLCYGAATRSPSSEYLLVLPRCRQALAGSCVWSDHPARQEGGLFGMTRDQSSPNHPLHQCGNKSTVFRTAVPWITSPRSAKIVALLPSKRHASSGLRSGRGDRRGTRLPSHRFRASLSSAGPVEGNADERHTGFRATPTPLCRSRPVAL
jgi:hypothetical protein